ncbi:acyltransferase family protein [Sphingobium sp. CAP-1]|uniref:acyltransferase family protein n=1 Tax=Sphingobium sp. CAP-1 TaxID=2676077 RepID=UPI0012BB301C|nr:acyltransferase [Sphingobium sp. CAP-1]QGP78928.1 acyltransferase family protein [Sphingobium sp. CAP-1]
MSQSLLTSAARRSDAIAIARVLCIVGVVYVHGWTGLNGEALAGLRGTAQDNLRWFLMELFGRSAVPLLGLISGWLVAGSRRTSDWAGHVRRKARTILLPMILWNIIAILLVSGAARLAGLQAPQPQSLWWTIDEVLIVTRNPDINVQMPFLRDLFLCMVAAPLLVRLPGRALALIGLTAAACHIAGLGPPLLMRASILFFFTTGILARRGGWAEWAAALPLPVAILPFALLMAGQLYLMVAGGGTRLALNLLDMAVRVAATLAFWRLAWALAGSNARGLLLRIEPYAFFLFCAHLILIWLGGPLLGGLFGEMGTPLYPLYLLLQPAIVLSVVMLVGTALRHLAPGAAEILSGGRLKGARQAISRVAMA